MTAYHSLRLFQIVSKYIPNQDDSRDFVTEVEAVVRDQLQMETNTLATKSELFQVKDELRKEIHQFRDELKGDINRLEVRMEQGFKDQLKWIILLMLGFSSLIITVVKFL
jgi:hypothetical protein